MPRRLRFLPVLTLTLSLVVAASFAWSVLHTADSPGTAYFVTTTRAWQLGVGALLALLTPTLARLPRPAATPTAWAPGRAGPTHPPAVLGPPETQAHAGPALPVLYLPDPGRGAAQFLRPTPGAPSAA